VAIETAGTWHYQAVELIQEVGRRTANIIGDARETTYLFQQPITLQRENAVAFQSTFTTSYSLLQFVIFICFLIPAGHKKKKKKKE